MPGRRQKQKEPTWSNPDTSGQNHVGLLVNGPPGTAGLPFI
jgi:hypothetical protein